MCTRSRSWFVSPRCSILSKKPNKMLGEGGGGGEERQGKWEVRGGERGVGAEGGTLLHLVIGQVNI